MTLRDHIPRGQMQTSNEAADDFEQDGVDALATYGVKATLALAMSPRDEGLGEYQRSYAYKVSNGDLSAYEAAGIINARLPA